MGRKGGAPAEFVYGLGISSLQPADQLDNEETPLRFVSVQLQLADLGKNLDVDIHAFLFESDGTYVDCVFYKNPTLAGRSVRLLQHDQELLVDLRYIPQRCSFIVCTLAIYSGGTVAQLGDGSVQLSALVPRVGLEENVDFPHLPCGQIPPGSSEFYEWVCLGTLPLRPRSSLGEECGMMLCLLAHHAGFWYFKPVLKPVTAFTPQGLIEPAQDYVTRHVAGLSEQFPGVELGSLLKAVREGTHGQFELADTAERQAEAAAGHHALRTSESGAPKGIGLETGDAVESVLKNEHSEIYREKNKRHGVLTENQEKVTVEETPGKQAASLLQGTADSSLDGITAQVQGRRKLPQYPIAGHSGNYDDGQFQASEVQPSDMEDHPNDGGERRGNTTQKEAGNISQGGEGDECLGGLSKRQRGTRVKDIGASQEAVSGKQKGSGGGASRFYWESRSDDKLTRNHVPVDGVSLVGSFPPVNDYGGDSCHGGMNAYDERDTAERNDWWRKSVERRLGALERSVESIGGNIQMIAAATSEMQKNNKLYIQELRERFTELKSDVASDIESALSGPLEALSLRVDAVKDDGGTDAAQLAEQRRKLWAVDRMVLLLERNWHLLAQSISELRFQLSGLEQRIEQAVPAIRDSPVLPTDHAKGLPLSLQPPVFMNSIGAPIDGEVPEASRRTQSYAAGAQQGGGQTLFASKALEELSRMQNHAEAFGACMRRLASGTAPDGLKGLNPVERRVLSFLGTPKAFAALQDLERALETINMCGPGTSGTRLY
ncbi:hypothetical protein, conserved [Eimeria praecox]|uniref:Uncharacterized protein n=1 Tax=Eimeria praecox TaxID=51316 RepID=U6H6Y1_9EIME|nr:hypothetical protein, conserved [Eimeria praecox]